MFERTILSCALALGILLATGGTQAQAQPARDAAKARTEMQAAGVVDPGNDPQTLNGLGYQALYGAGDAQQALQLFRWNLALFPDDGVVHANLLDSYAEGLIIEGDRAGAIKALEAALAITPEIQSNPDAAKNLALLKKDPKNLAMLQAKLREAGRAALSGP